MQLQEAQGRKRLFSKYCALTPQDYIKYVDIKRLAFVLVKVCAAATR